MESGQIESKSFVHCLHERALDNFMNSIDIRYDFQKHLYRGITLVVVNLSRAVMCESQVFYRYLFKVIDEGAEKIVIDISSLEFMDSSFAGVLVAALKRVKNKCGDIRLVINNANLLTSQVLLNGIIKIYKTYPTIKKALQSYEGEKEKVTPSISHLSFQK
ncbi:MAG: hypothetical protein COW85_15150 [Ignavibacteria bacterium CG22_combo_CG10-13_8_21_14_all_37_15]|nr:STAS domain-containing protein [Ignavibacteria bacterium]OIO22465.1 MAG: hypothetical protein AUJ54_03385 [Ignavibacteria bacterium CG1_02_37_35]PIP76259.1 MAG: hypothetical protein COW85_15150 [Ignavibacteria bacterium CG22_combo_CG10-13_8_21_14_all_37_15]PIS44662.1 MAG: hypothetical protein COT22_09365 [Ignavibacteria bacterium CG08_land_8_20_14_0_20_37_9]PIX92995.1 MAG: hypothetical protein COZ25_12990 [Ignavibacteria bacterium CG_4_10_14_3_um_filter_37_18]PJC59116.1 MAG: hypothetical pr